MREARLSMSPNVNWTPFHSKAGVARRPMRDRSNREGRVKPPILLGAGGFSFIEESGDEARVDLARAKLRILEDALVQRNGGVDAFNDEHVERAKGALDGFLTRAGVADELGHE